MGRLPGYRDVWYDKDGIANILSKKKYYMCYNSDEGGVFMVTKPDGRKFEFVKYAKGLHFLNTAQQSNENAGTTHWP